MKTLNKKQLFTIILCWGLLVIPSNVNADTSNLVLDYGVSSLGYDLDPHQAWDSASIDLIHQVCEGLFGYDLTDPELGIIPVLAAYMGSWNAEATEYTVQLKQGVTFHDGTSFDAYDVQWSFDRLNWLIENGYVQIAELYEPLKNQFPVTPRVIASTEVLNTYSVKFHLNYPFVPFVSLLCFTGSVILSPESTPQTELMEFGSHTLVGTGPYIFSEYDGTYTRTLAFANWHGTRPNDYINEIRWVKYDDNIAKNEDFLVGNLDLLDSYLPDYIQQYEDSTDIVLGEQVELAVIYYIGMNNKIINQTMRQVINWAFNYDDFFNDILEVDAVQAISPVPAGFLYHNPYVSAPYYDVIYARQLLINEGLAPGDAGSYLYD
ncbi:MAG: ABC transporter substrate-binding protein, partial [Promethearchaeota archaeon]